MGILGLGTLLSERAPKATKEGGLKHYFGRKIAIDASMSIYQFVIAMTGFQNGESTELSTGPGGEVTTHLNGLWSRTLKMIDEGIKPVYVFDGKPPELKKKELDKRKARQAAAQADMATAKEEGDDVAMTKAAGRSVRITREQMDECKKLLKLMGLPVIEASGEAEAQCVELVKNEKCWAVATEDMDALAFGAPLMLRHLAHGDEKKRPVVEYRIDHVLQQLNLTQKQFIDLCILMGCDYCCKINGIGPIKALDAIRQHDTIEAVIENLDKAKYPVPADFVYEKARELFNKPDVTPAADVKIEFKEPDVEGLMKYMVEEKQFSPERIQKGIDRLKSALQKKSQVRLDDFFKVKPKEVGKHDFVKQKKEAGTRRTASGQPAGNKPGNSAATTAAAAGGGGGNTNTAAAATAGSKAKGHKKAVEK